MEGRRVMSGLIQIKRDFNAERIDRNDKQRRNRLGNVQIVWGRAFVEDIGVRRSQP